MDSAGDYIHLESLPLLISVQPKSCAIIKNAAGTIQQRDDYKHKEMTRPDYILN